ncbi:MAG TPA: hypothetical protein VL463_17475 [Kofleriaceae bacterium]|nr:hypothetical protein [Kofleriaceae bacterium]
MVAELGGIAYTSPDAPELAGTLGLQWSPNPWIDLSVVGLFGLASGSDPYGLLVGLSPKARLWH